jgi:hypothetical protein
MFFFFSFLYCCAVSGYLVALQRFLWCSKYIILEFTHSTSLLGPPHTWNTFNRYHFCIYIHVYTLFAPLKNVLNLQRIIYEDLYLNHPTAGAWIFICVYMFCLIIHLCKLYYQLLHFEFLPLKKAYYLKTSIVVMESKLSSYKLFFRLFKITRDYFGN